MQIRVVIPAILWLSAMILVFAAPVNEFSTQFIGGISSRIILHSFLFAGFSLSLLSMFHKQLRYKNLKRNANSITLGVGIFVAAFSEVVMIGLNHHGNLDFWNLTMNVLGIIIGMITFKILYKECC